MSQPKRGNAVPCYHCGEPSDPPVMAEGRTFCCNGCRLVFGILNENGLCSYYRLSDTPGTRQDDTPTNDRFAFLDKPAIAERLVAFRNGNQIHVTFPVPSIHCSSCIYLLENLHRIENGVQSARVDFLRKEVRIVFDKSMTTLRQVCERMASVGYEPAIHLDAMDRKAAKRPDRGRIRRIGVAGFCLGNIMLLSFPEYFSATITSEPKLVPFFRILLLSLALPVFFYSASEFFLNAWKGLRQKTVLIDLPISIGIIAMFLRSAWEVTSGTGPGYFDSMAGLVFFMLVGRKFQDFTFDSLSFDRDYKSYFPIGVTVSGRDGERVVSAYDLAVNDVVLVRNKEIIPADGILDGGSASIDYSFVTGESRPVAVAAGETVYAGGRQLGSAVKVRVTRRVTQSHITRLWSQGEYRKQPSRYQHLAHTISRWFVGATLAIATSAAVYWYVADPSRSLHAFTSVLVIACACALALSPTFTYGQMLRLLGRRKIFFRNNEALERLADVDTVVFDKTGTLTSCESLEVSSETGLNKEERMMVASLARNSTHPLSLQLAGSLGDNGNWMEVRDFREQAGQGVSGIVAGRYVKIGSGRFAGTPEKRLSDTGTYVNIGGKTKGVFHAGHAFRPGLESLAARLRGMGYRLSVITGDHERDRDRLAKIFGPQTDLRFNQSPQEKLDYVKSLQAKGHRVLMVGDGLNDAGALMQSEVGISVSDKVNNFTPAADGILDAGRLDRLAAVLRYSHSAIGLIRTGFLLSLAYNVVGLSFAVQGTLSPVVAAILMPVSTVSLVLFAVAASWIRGKQLVGT